MSMKPDEEVLALWVEDELSSEQQAEVDRWAAEQSEWLERRDQARAWKSLASGVLPASEDVPHAEFFNARIRREIELEARKAEPVPAPAAVPSNRWGWFMPLTAAAGLVLGFWLGKGGPASDGSEVKAPVASLAPVLYTPTKGVKAEYVSSDDATVIVLAGVDAIPDDWEIPETAMIEKDDGPRTVFLESK
ncbi:MAG: hypothetical protein AAGI48_03020 [Verrucomicrobiota bacterium]